jgi:Ca2+-dependent lipid-binding protein
LFTLYLIFSIFPSLSIITQQLHLKLSFSRPPTKVRAAFGASRDDGDLEAGQEEEENPDEADEQPNELNITVVQARRLEIKDTSIFGNGSSDPQVRLKIVGFDTQKTPFIRKNLNPVWNSKHTFRGVDDTSASVVVIVEDHNDIKTPDFMGKISIPLAQFNDKKPMKQWYKLRNKEMEVDGVDRGEIELLFHWKFNLEVLHAHPNLLRNETLCLI